LWAKNRNSTEIDTCCSTTPHKITFVFYFQVKSLQLDIYSHTIHKCQMMTALKACNRTFKVLCFSSTISLMQYKYTNILFREMDKGITNDLRQLFIFLNDTNIFNSNLINSFFLNTLNMLLKRYFVRVLYRQLIQTITNDNKYILSRNFKTKCYETVHRTIHLTIHRTSNNYTVHREEANSRHYLNLVKPM